jgi:hypothetical protein
MVDDQATNQMGNSAIRNRATAVRTLTTGGFILKGADRKPGYNLLYFSRFDEFGVVQDYCFALADNKLSEDQVKGASIAANHHHAHLVIIGNSNVHPGVEWDRFVNLFGGPVLNTGPLEPGFAEQLVELGHNSLPNGLQGKPDDLFELYVHAALEFILGGRVLRYGQARLYEALPDGWAIPNPHFSALYDAKAYEDGYEVTADSMRQFKSYIELFNRRYSSYYRLNAFVVISGEFQNKDSTLDKRSRELLADTGVPISFLDANSLADILKLLAKYPLVRRSINWARIFSDVIVQSQMVMKELKVIQKDGIIRR